jgi:hypothetical protein
MTKCLGLQSWVLPQGTGQLLRRRWWPWVYCSLLLMAQHLACRQWGGVGIGRQREVNVCHSMDVKGRRQAQNDHNINLGTHNRHGSTCGCCSRLAQADSVDSSAPLPTSQQQQQYTATYQPTGMGHVCTLLPVCC